MYRERNRKIRREMLLQHPIVEARHPLILRPDALIFSELCEPLKDQFPVVFQRLYGVPFFVHGRTIRDTARGQYPMKPGKKE